MDSIDFLEIRKQYVQRLGGDFDYERFLEDVDQINQKVMNVVSETNDAINA